MLSIMFRAACIVVALLIARAAPAVECRYVAATGGGPFGQMIGVVVPLTPGK